MKRLVICALFVCCGAAQAFTLDSLQVKPGGTVALAQVYERCGGGNISPALRWHDPPANTRSFAVTVFDPDAPGGGFWHWIALDIGAGAHGLNADAGAAHSGNAPGGTVQLINGFGKRGYSGPCPPPGKPHRYVFTVYALDVPTLSFDGSASAAAASAAITKHALGQATLTASYGR